MVSLLAMALTLVTATALGLVWLVFVLPAVWALVSMLV